MCSLLKLVVFQESGKHPSQEIGKISDRDDFGESSHSEFNENSYGIDTTPSKENSGAVESSKTPENVESVCESKNRYCTKGNVMMNPS